MVDKYGTEQDPYIYPDSDVLINKLNIRSQAVLNQAEREFFELATEDIELPLPPYDLACWCQLHHQIFKDLYTWAGKLRTIDISKGNTRFCNVHRIKPEADKLFSQLASDHYLVGLEYDLFVSKLAEYYAELNIIHPFREGNGRAQRLLFESIVINCGYSISLEHVEQDEWLQANIAGYYGDYQPLIEILKKCVGEDS